MKIWNLGYPRVGRKRELKKALEGYLSHHSSREALEKTARELLSARWARQHELGVESIPVGDFSYYDHVLDMSVLLGAIPERFRKSMHGTNLHWMDLYFAMARGVREGESDIAALDMTKWFNTNYHYLVPEIDGATRFQLHWDKLFFELEHCRSYPYRFHPVLIGPMTYVRLSRLHAVTPNDVIAKIVPLYREILTEFKRRNFQWVQIDEPILCSDLLRDDVRAVRKIYDELAGVGPSIMLATYFESPDPWLSEIANLPVEGIHFDLVHGPLSKDWLKTKVFPDDKTLSLGIVSGRNVWAAPLHELESTLTELLDIYASDKCWITPSCSLLHLPHDKQMETRWDNEFSSWVSFADQRLEELHLLKRALSGDAAAESVVNEREQTLQKKNVSSRVHKHGVKKAVERIDSQTKTRKSPFAKRMRVQNALLKMPILPTTTIGSFPQTQEIRKARLEWKKGRMNEGEYQAFLKSEIERVVRLQEKLELDVLVHGECERNDMVEYFAEFLEGFEFSDNGWVQSYGSRCVKPPLLFGDVKRKRAMTVGWFQYAQSLTPRPMKGMITGPVTLLNWSFVRDDQPREKTTFQIALAIREETKDLEMAGARIIQIDEAALREGLPMKHQDWSDYLRWAVDSFRICASVAKDETQIQTHMCYSEFGDIMEAICKLDADVLLIEFARSGPSFTAAFKKTPYLNQIGPGVFDIHSPRVPTVNECEQNIRQILQLFPPERVWVNPDCGLKTRRFEEVEPALQNMVDGARRVRESIKK